METYEEWLAAVVLANTVEEVKIVQVTQTQLLNWWRFSIEIYLIIIEGDRKELPEIIEVSEGKGLNVVVEGWSLTCYRCDQKGHIRKRYHLAIQHKEDSHTVLNEC